jgi:hypothetical protein
MEAGIHTTLVTSFGARSILLRGKNKAAFSLQH